MSNIIDFPGCSAGALGYTLRNPSFDYGQRAPKTRNRRNPLRKYLESVSLAIVEANKLDPPPETLELVRQGAASARALADEFTRIINANGGHKPCSSRAVTAGREPSDGLSAGRARMRWAGSDVGTRGAAGSRPAGLQRTSTPPDNRQRQDHEQGRGVH